jgi:two-component system NarL family sensor kinase
VAAFEEDPLIQVNRRGGAAAISSPTPLDSRGNRARTVSVPRAVAAFLVAGLVVIAAVGVMLVVALRQGATAEAIRDARALTRLEATNVVGPVLNNRALVPGQENNALDQVVRHRVIGRQVVRVKIWDATGRIVYSDDTALVGKRFPLPADELTVLRTGGESAEVSDLSRSENMGEKSFGRLLQVYLGVRTPTGQRLLFETYQPYADITESSRQLWLTSLPVLLGGLILLYLVQAPLAYRMAIRLRRSQDEREAMLLASLAASDKERATIASDLHDGVVQGIAGASYSLSAAAERVPASDPDTAQIMTSTAKDLRRWVRELRSLVVTIIPPQLHAQGLATSLADLAATLELRGLSVHVDVTGTQHLDETTETVVYRVAQEAVRNVVRHSDARSVTMRLAREVVAGSGRPQDVLVFRICDDGVGFEPGRTAARSRGSVGLELLSALVTSHGGNLSVQASPGNGTEVLLRVPLVPVVEPPTAAAAPAQMRAGALR